MSGSGTAASAHPAPLKDRVSLATLLFATCAAPIFWLGQMMLGYGVTAYICYPGDHPQPASGDALLNAVLLFDVVAVVACVAGGAVSWWAWRRTRTEKAGGERHALHTGEGRARFMALWGIMSSLAFLGAVLFNTIASLWVSPCLI